MYWLINEKRTLNRSASLENLTGVGIALCITVTLPYSSITDHEREGGFTSTQN
jgi:hypothetical protein